MSRTIKAHKEAVEGLGRRKMADQTNRNDPSVEVVIQLVLSVFPSKDFKSWPRFHGSRSTMFSRNPLSNISRTVLDFYAGLFAPRQESNSCQSSNCHLAQVQGNPPFSVLISSSNWDIHSPSIRPLRRKMVESP